MGVRRERKRELGELFYDLTYKRKNNHHYNELWVKISPNLPIKEAELLSINIHGTIDYTSPCSNYAEELADVIIASMSVAGKLGIDIDAAVRRKLEINKARPWKHGKKNEGEA